ncbi:hypothetical protein [Bacillus amyloliquefaciens]|uniref:hypothetical protein n=1 Tax=Bacillus amyloliquefaciens TaxID=1390 RepID=UPI0028092D0C|nr:hypothetical protein [Bacillus amyloliquefaciens]MDQ8093323.1 hypothetical protein [Bacillus amyloliquefaciens]
MNLNNSFLREREIKFIFPFFYYALSLACYLSTLLPYMNSLIPKNINILSNIKHLDYVIALSALFLLLFGVFFEGFIMFLIANFLGAQVKFKMFLAIFFFANLPLALKFIIISIKNVFIENPNTYLIFSSNNVIFKGLDLFNLLYLMLLATLLKNRSNLKNNISLGVFIFIALLYRIIF